MVVSVVGTFFSTMVCLEEYDMIDQKGVVLHAFSE